MTELTSGSKLRGQRYVQEGSVWVLRDVSYRLMRQLGKGGMATVWLALTVGTSTDDPDAQVAIKIIGTDDESGSVSTRTRTRDEMHQRFLRERDTLARLCHPHVVRFIAFGETDDGRTFFVIRYHSGVSLDDLIWEELKSKRLCIVDRHSETSEPRERQRGTEEKGTYKKHAALFRFPIILEIMEHLLEASQYCSEQGITHRDLKAANVMCLMTDSGPTDICVLDFGIAKIAHANGVPHVQTLTREQSVFGTPSYMSPEQLKDSKPVDVSCDIFAIGMILLELTTGVRRGATAWTMQQQLSICLLDEGSHDPADYVHAVPLALRNIVKKATAKEAKDRYQTPREMLEAILDAKATLADELSHRRSRRGRNNTLSRAPTVPASDPPGPPSSRSSSRNVSRIVGMVMATFFIGGVGLMVFGRYRDGVEYVPRMNSMVMTEVPTMQTSLVQKGEVNVQAPSAPTQETAVQTFRLGALYLERGRRVEACEKFRQVQSLTPDYPGLKAKLAQCEK